MSTGLFGTLGMAARSLQTQQAGIAVTGHNLANVNNPAYARQRLNIATTDPVQSPIGPLGTGAQALAIQQIRHALVDRQVVVETGLTAYWEAHQLALEFAQAGLGQTVQRVGNADASTMTGLAEGLAELFRAFQSLSLQPSSLAERQVLMLKAGTLASQFNQIAARLRTASQMQNETLQADVRVANQLLSDIAQLNDEIVVMELNSGAAANDLRDLRQQKLEELGRYVDFTSVPQNNGAINIVVDGVLMVSDRTRVDSLEVYDAGGGQLLVRAATAGTPLNLRAGSLAGVIAVRDGALAQLRVNLDLLAATLIQEVNAIHSTGFGLNGTTGAAFFIGTDAASIAVNSVLVTDPARVQASNAPGEPGNNAVVLQLAQLAQQRHAALGNQTFAESFHRIVTMLGQELVTATNRVRDQQLISEMLRQQRASISGVSLDEEMVALTAYQRAYQASARLMTVIDELLEDLVRVR
ncbi:MAG: flagellar hook-associated protein FlgK [Verrucomicrobiae bacterium]|nr:flagellar hook-associated protein FlgK [Verrucomicrobiae bacterium]